MDCLLAVPESPKEAKQVRMYVCMYDLRKGREREGSREAALASFMRSPVPVLRTSTIPSDPSDPLALDMGARNGPITRITPLQPVSGVVRSACSPASPASLASPHFPYSTRRAHTVCTGRLGIVP